MANKSEIPGQIEPINDEHRLTNPVWYEWFLFTQQLLRSIQASIAPIFAPWTTTFVPVLTSGGVGPPSATMSVRYRRIGNVVDVSYLIQITALNGATGGLFATLPVAPAIRNAVLVGCEYSLNGKMLRGSITAAGNTASIAYFDNTSVLVVGTVIQINGSYEV